jgi:hypothetical protein
MGSSLSIYKGLSFEGCSMTKQEYEDERAQIFWDYNKGKYDAKFRDGLLASLERDYKETIDN